MVTDDLDMIEIVNLTKRYGDFLAVDDLSFQARPGQVTGLLGPNGAGKSTTMDVTFGLKSPTAGTALVKGKHYTDLASPLRTVGAVLEGAGAHPRHRVRDHLRWIATSHVIPLRRIEEVLSIVALDSYGHRRIHTLSTGLRQRLALAVALLGDPEVLILDEAGGGLDVDGARWLRKLMRSLAEEGRTVLVSSHVLSEVETVADHLIVIVRGRLVADTTPEELGGTPTTMRVASAAGNQLKETLEGTGATVETQPDGTLLVSGLEPGAISRFAAEASMTITELTPVRRSLEESYIDLLGEKGQR